MFFPWTRNFSFTHNKYEWTWIIGNFSPQILPNFFFGKVQNHTIYFLHFTCQVFYFNKIWWHINFSDINIDPPPHPLKLNGCCLTNVADFIKLLLGGLGRGVWLFNATFDNISGILWQSVLLVEETGVTVENHWPVASHWQTLSHNVVSSMSCHEQGSNSQQ
jgi:hypothetical protein